MRLACAFAGVLVTVPASADEASEPVAAPPAPVASTAARPPLAEHLGYAFAHPDVLLRQRLLGLAHGLRLLGRTCLLDSEFSRASEAAYGAWYARQRMTLARIVDDLETWHYGSPSVDDVDVRLRQLAALLGLPARLRALGSDEQRAACASFAPAIATARYDLRLLLAGESGGVGAGDGAGVGAAPADAVVPAPTLQATPAAATPDDETIPGGVAAPSAEAPDADANPSADITPDAETASATAAMPGAESSASADVSSAPATLPENSPHD